MLQSRNLASKLLAQRVCTRVCSSPGRMTCRNQSSGPNKSSGVRSAVLIGTGTAAGSVVGTLGYAWYDPAFRTAVESTVPYSDVLFSSVIGQHPSVAPSISAPLKSIYPPKTSTKSAGLGTEQPEASLSQSKDIASKSEPAVAVKTSPPLLIESSPAAPVAPPASSSASVAPPASSSASVAPSALSSAPVEPPASSSAPVAPPASSNTSTSSAFSADAVSPAAEALSTSGSVVQSTAAVQLPEDTGDSLQQLLDSLSETTMQALHEAIAAQERAAAAVSDHVDVVFKNISDSAATTWDDVTHSAFLKKQLCDAADQLAATAKDSIGQLKKAVRQAEQSTSAHTNDRLISAQQTLAMAYRTLEMAKLKHKRMESAGLTADQLRTELSRHQHKLEMDYRRQMVVFQEELEAQLRQQLRRQAAAHSDHIQDVLVAQEEELARRHEAAHEHQLRMERLKQEATSSAMMGQLAGLQEALKDRADLDAVSLASHRMWTACLALYRAVATPSTDATHQRTCIQQQTDIIRRFSDDGDVLVQLVLSSLPACALREGVASEHQLKQRFFRLERVCRRVGMIDDRGGSLFKYALSYLQALLVVDAYDPAPGAAHSEPISADIDTFGLVARARYAMDVGDLTQAVRYMSMLRGESGRAASDWLRESRQLLEVRQAAEALMAHAASSGLQATHTD